MNISFLEWRDSLLKYRDKLKNYKPVLSSYEFLNNKLYYQQGLIMTIVGRPGHGKTTLSECIVDDIENNNIKDGSIKIVDYQLEMPAFKLTEQLLRRYKLNPYSEDDLKKLYEMKKYREGNYFILESFVGFSEMYAFCSSVFEKNKKENAINMVLFDHALILPDRRNTIPSLMQVAIKLKKEYNAIVIILSQLNRQVNSKDRAKAGSDKAKISDADIYDTDALMQYSDLLISVDVPYKRGIKVYGSEELILDRNHTIIRILKDRITDTDGDEYLYVRDNLQFRFEKKLNMPYMEDNNYSSDSYTSNNVITEQVDDINDSSDELEF